MSLEAETGLSDSVAIVKPMLPFLSGPMSTPPYLEALLSRKETAFELATIYMQGERVARERLYKLREEFLKNEAELQEEAPEEAEEESKAEEAELEAKAEKSEHEAKAEKPEEIVNV